MAEAKTAVLLSAGLDSAVLAAAEATTSIVQPIYVETGLAWEADELRILDSLLATPPYTRLRPLARLAFTARDLYPASHWALRGDAPAFDTPDEDVYLTGRNVMLLSKAAIYCAQHDIDRIALALLAGNPFPDATPEFLASMANALSLGLKHPLHVATPFSGMHKPEVVLLGVTLAVPMERTLSCMSPKRGQHCGRCSKCRERRDAFHEATVQDPTTYAETPIR